MAFFGLDDRRLNERRHRLRDRADQAGRNQSRLHPDARSKWREARRDGTDKEVALSTLQRAVDSSLTLRSKSDLIMDFVERVSATGAIDDEWRAYVEAKRVAELDDILAEEGLKYEETKAFIAHAFRDGRIATTGTAVTRIIPPVSRFAADGGRGEKKQRVLTRLAEFFERFFGLSSDRS